MVSATRIASPARATRTLVMLHGIYGRGRNWQAIAKSLVDARPEYACWLVDLPHHGDSGAGAHGNTVRGLAADVNGWLAAEGLAADAVLGHSFGGKVALAMAAAQPARAVEVWVIDSTPDAKPPSGSAWDMLRVIRSLPGRFASRDEAASALVAAGYAPAVGHWMSTNLRREGDEFVWRLDFGVMEELLRDFFATDLWPAIEHPAPGHHIHVLKASESSVLSAGAIERLEAAPRAQVSLHHLQGGHWIHTESPAAVTALIARHLGGDH